jgi:hypothetical protein
MNIQQIRDDEERRVIAFIYANKEKWTREEQEKFIDYVMDKSDSTILEQTIRETFNQMNNIH